MHTIDSVVFLDLYMLGFAAFTVFELANLALDEPAYAVAVLRAPSGMPSGCGYVGEQPFVLLFLGMS